MYSRPPWLAAAAPKLASGIVVSEVHAACEGCASVSSPRSTRSVALRSTGQHLRWAIGALRPEGQGAIPAPPEIPGVARARRARREESGRRGGKPRGAMQAGLGEAAGSGALLLLLCRREQDVVEDQAIAGRVSELAQIRGGVADHVLVVLGIVSAEEREGAAAELAVQVLDLL